MFYAKYSFTYFTRSIIQIFIATLFLGCAATPGASSKFSSPPIVEIPIPLQVVTVSSSGLAPILPVKEPQWITTGSFDYRIGNTLHVITIPKGFVTDLASIPQILWSFGLSPIGRYMSAAIIHDYLYWDQRCTKEEADDVLRTAMYEDQVGKVPRWLVFQGVSLFGKSSFEKNARLKKEGIRRFLEPVYADAIVEASRTSSPWSSDVFSDTNRTDSRIHDMGNPKLKEFCEAAAELASRL